MSEAKVRRLGGREATQARIPGDYALSVGRPDHPAPVGWRWELLTDLARLESGHTPSRKRPEYWGGEVPWIGIRDATANHGRTIDGTNENTNALGIENSAARVLPAGTVCLSRTASVGYVVVMGRPMATSQDFVNWTCGDQLDNRFLKYALIAEGDALLRFASGSVHQTIYFPEVKSFYLATPPLAEQRAVADCLAAFEAKIELNRRMNETLEAMAQAIFRDWFVDFGPTRRKMAGATDPVAIMGGLTPDPARAKALEGIFPAALGDDGIPVGWAERPLDSIATFLNGVALQKYPAEHGRESLPVIKIAELRNGIGAGTGRASRSIPKKYLIQNGDFVFSWSGSLMAKFWTEGEGALNQHLFKVSSSDFPSWFYALWVQQHMDDFRQIAASKATTMGHIQRGHLSAARTVGPNREDLPTLGEVLDPLVARVIHNDLEARTLAATRDLLLPKLMSGEIRLNAV